ncbi:hypothetical protein cypCar_00049651, partial [Cyprinus carpio]
PKITKEKPKPAPKKEALVIKEKAKPAPVKKESEIIKEERKKAKPAPKKKVAEVTKEKAKQAPMKKEPEVTKEKLLEPTPKKELLNSISQKLSLLDLLRKDIGEMKSDLESTQNQITLLRMDNRTIKEPKTVGVKVKPAVSKEKVKTAKKDHDALMNVTAHIKAEAEIIKKIKDKVKLAPLKKERDALKNI